jgi:hypothetical protein
VAARRMARSAASLRGLPRTDAVPLLPGGIGALLIGFPPYGIYETIRIG